MLSLIEHDARLRTAISETANVRQFSCVTLDGDDDLQKPKIAAYRLKKILYENSNNFLMMYRV